MHHGSCLCKRVAFQASSLQGPFLYCHCQSCQKSSGAAFGANISAPLDGFRIVSGEDLISVYESSPKKFRHFCRVCGSPLFTKVGDKPSIVRIRLGTLNCAIAHKRAAHIFVDEKASWYEIADRAQRFPAWPDPDVISIPGSRQTAT